MKGSCKKLKLEFGNKFIKSFGQKFKLVFGNKFIERFLSRVKIRISYQVYCKVLVKSWN